MMGLIVGDTTKGAVTLLPTASGVKMLFKDGAGKVFASFDLDNEKALWIGRKLVEFGNRQHPNGVNITGSLKTTGG
jgi:hypothetical protein